MLALEEPQLNGGIYSVQHPLRMVVTIFRPLKHSLNCLGPPNQIVAPANLGNPSRIRRFSFREQFLSLGAFVGSSFTDSVKNSAPMMLCGPRGQRIRFACVIPM